MPASANSRVLVIGYGCTLRGDDGIGRFVADAIRRQHRPHVEVMSVTQLVPELAEPVAAAEAVIFVDAYCGDDLKTVEVRKLVLEPAAAGQSHYVDPVAILRLSQTCYQRVPRAWLVSVPVQRFEISCDLSAAARRQADAVEHIVGKLIEDALKREVLHA